MAELNEHSAIIKTSQKSCSVHEERVEKTRARVHVAAFFLTEEHWQGAGERWDETHTTTKLVQGDEKVSASIF